MTNIIQYIEFQGGMLSGELADYISKTAKISNSAARKRISRLKSPIHKLSGFFKDNQSFIYHSSNYNSTQYYENLYEAIKKGAKRCYLIIVAIKYYHGKLSLQELPNYSMSPVKKIKGHMKFDTIIEKLTSANVLSLVDDYVELNPHFSQTAIINHRHCQGIEFAKQLLVNQFSSWARNTGIASFESIRTNGVVSGFQFGITAPSYLNGLVIFGEGKPKPGFLVCDVLIGNSTTEEQIEFYLQKIYALKMKTPNIRLFPVILADGIKLEGLQKLKSLGVMIASVRELFGNEYNELLNSLINTITNAGAILKTNPEKYIELMVSLNKLVDGKTNNLRGDLFELAVGYYYSKYCKSLDIGKRVRHESEPNPKEIDVLASFENKVICIECKGYNYPVDKDYIEDYLSKKIPALKKWLKANYNERRIQFEIWSTGGFTEDALKILKVAKTKTKKYDIDYFGSKEIYTKASEINSKKFKEILKEYYMKEAI